MRLPKKTEVAPNGQIHRDSRLPKTLPTTVGAGRDHFSSRVFFAERDALTWAGIVSFDNTEPPPTRPLSHLATASCSSPRARGRCSFVHPQHRPPPGPRTTTISGWKPSAMDRVL